MRVLDGYWRILVCPTLLTFALLTTGCEQAPDKPKKGELPPAGGLRKGAATDDVYTTFYPLAYFAERIAGDTVKIVNPCPPDADPATWMPDDDTLVKYQEAALILVNGASFEQWVDKVSLPELRTVNTTRPLTLNLLTYEDAVVHSHGPEGQHAHEGIDGHTWLSPRNCRIQARTIRDALNRTFPDHAARFDEGYAALERDLNALDVRHKELARLLEEDPIIAAHPAYNYIASEYGWNVKNFHFDPDVMPDENALAELQAFLNEAPAPIILWEAQPQPAIAERFQDEFNLISVVFSPCESKPAGKADFISVMHANIDRLEAAATAGLE